MSVAFTLKSPLTEPFLLMLKDPAKAALFKAHNFDSYEGRIWLVLNRLNSLDEELRHLLKELTTPEFPVHTSVLIKMYHITIDTMSDVFAWFISEVFDLGYDAKQITMGEILKNRHVQASGVAQVFRGNFASLRKAQFDRTRNDIVHRGLLDEKQLHECDWLMTTIIADNMESGRPLDAGMDVLATKLNAFRIAKQSELSAHYDMVMKALNEVMSRLADEMRKRQK
jgi:hypothetical protein